MDENEYLQPDFDPASYKIPQLRNVLLQNDVSYPNGAKKKDLVELFNTHIKPTAEGRLKELQGVVANDEGIVYVEKKSKKSKDTEQNSSSTLKVEKTRKNPSKKAKETEEPEVRRSPRKTSKSTMLEQLEADDSDDDIQIIDESQVSPRKARGSARNASGDLGKIPVLKKSPPRTRERSPRRKASGNAKSEEPEQSEEFKPRERSPRRKVSDKKDSKTTRERSPAKKVKEETKAEPKPKKEAKKKSKAKEEPKPKDRAGDESDDADLEQVTQQEFEQASPYKFGSKFESSFSKDNVFQSPGHSSPDVKPKKTIPRKRASENTSKSPRKSTKSIRKTAFSSSPEPAQNIKSPAKKALEISKFETSSPPSNFVKNDIAEGDIFESEEFSKQPFKFENVTEKIPSSIKKPTINENDKFETPNDGNASKISNLSSASSTPSKSGIKRKSLLPDFSKFKVSREFAKTLGITVQGEPEQESKEQDSNKDEDPELIDIAGEDEDEDEEDSDEPEQTANDDSVLRNLQEEIDSANSAVQKEADDAIKQVNDIFNEDKDTEKVSSNDKAEKSTPRTKSGFKFSAVFGFFKQLFVFFFFVFIVIFGLWYREQRILIGYCGNEIDQPTFPNAQNEYLVRFDEFLQTLKPKCLEAPENAITLPNLKIKCRPDYVVYEPWYKVHGFFPFSDYCVKDEEKENIIKEVVSKSLELLRTKNAETKCGDGDDFEVGISDEELYEFFFESKSSTISDDEFDELWSRVLVDLKNEPEITLRYTRDNDTGSTKDDLSSDEDEEETYLPKEQTIFRSNSKVKLSIRCKFQKEVHENFERNKKVLIGSSLILFTVLFLYQKIVSYQKRQSKIKEISDIIVIKLQKQQKNAISDSTGLTNRYVSNIQLRDELLSNLKNSEKYEIWESILNNLEKNSNVRGSTREIHGDIVKVYEWIGE